MSCSFENSQLYSYTINPYINHINQKIKQKIYATKKSHYSILNYDKDYICFDDKESSKYKSVICSYPEKQILCVAPIKSIPFNHFKQNRNGNSIVISEIMEGIMINLFYDSRIESWEIATKSAVGGKYGQKYNNSNSMFYDMFIDALAGNTEKQLNDNPTINMLPKWCCYSFVMTIEPIPKLTLISVCNIQIYNIIIIPSYIYKKWKVFESVHCVISFPNEYEYINYKNIVNRCMLTDYESGERTKWFHPDYIINKKINKIKPSLQYQYLCFRRINKVYNYLGFFPKQRNDFYLIEQQYEQYIDKVHQYYMEHFVKKTIQWQDIPIKFRDTIYKIHHSIRLDGLSKQMRIVITKNIVRDWLNKKDPKDVAYKLNL
jgi:hypothetical protein